MANESGTGNRRPPDGGDGMRWVYRVLFFLAGLLALCIAVFGASKV